MVQRVVLVVGMVLGMAGAARAQEIYQWRDGKGNAHFSNVPTTDGAPTGLHDDPSDAAAPSSNGDERTGVAGEGETPPAEAPGDAEAAYSSDASTRRSGLEHDLRDAQRRIREIDTKLIALAHARTRNAQGSAATGGVGTAAADVLSDEERTLTEERARQAKRMEALRASYDQLRDEVSARLGGTPDWWINVR